MDEMPKITLDARDVHAPAVLKALAAKHRAMDPARADELDRVAARFAAWRLKNPRVR